MVLEKDLKLESLAVEERLKQEKLKPKLKVKYNPMLSTADNVVPNYSLSDYKWHISFSMPILFRSERAGLQKTQVKILETQNERSEKVNSLSNKIAANQAQRSIIQEQIVIQTDNLARYRQLLAAEQTRFNIGESSVFLLNKRQEKYLDGQMKVIDLQAKLQSNFWENAYWNNNTISIIQ